MAAQVDHAPDPRSTRDAVTLLVVAIGIMGIGTLAGP